MIMKVSMKIFLHLIVDIWFCKNAVRDGLFYNHKGKRVFKKTTRGVDLLCTIKSGQNKDGSNRIRSSWYPLKKSKESSPLQVAEFAVARRVGKFLLLPRGLISR